MSVEKRHINAGGALVISSTLLASSFLLAIALAETSIGRSIAHLWPKYDILQAYCSSNECLFGPNLVQLIYLLNIVFAILVFIIISAHGWHKIPTNVTLIFRFVVVIILTLISLALILVPFDFETTGMRFYENSVTWSYLGITRAAWPSLLSIFLSVTGFMSDRQRFQQGG